MGRVGFLQQRHIAMSHATGFTADDTADAATPATTTVPATAVRLISSTLPGLHSHSLLCAEVTLSSY